MYYLRTVVQNSSLTVTRTVVEGMDGETTTAVEEAANTGTDTTTAATDAVMTTVAAADVPTDTAMTVTVESVVAGSVVATTVRTLRNLGARSFVLTWLQARLAVPLRTAAVAATAGMQVQDASLLQLEATAKIVAATISPKVLPFAR